MRPVSRGGRAVTYSKVGLMVLKEHFQQRPIEATFSSFRSMVPLRTPSGPQQVESELEAELLEQLAFAPGTYDLLTQPIIEYATNGRARRYTPDIIVQLHASGDDARTETLSSELMRHPNPETPANPAVNVGSARFAS